MFCTGCSFTPTSILPGHVGVFFHGVGIGEQLVDGIAHETPHDFSEEFRFALGCHAEAPTARPFWRIQ